MIYTGVSTTEKEDTEVGEKRNMGEKRERSKSVINRMGSKNEGRIIESWSNHFKLHSICL